MTEPLRVGLVGAGRIAELGHAPALARCASARLVAVADPARHRAEALAAATGARAFAEPGEMLAAGGLDALIVTSPPEHHLGHARLAAAAELPCLVEKPPAPDAAGARELAALDPAPWIGFNRRFWEPELTERLPAAEPVDLELELRYRRRSWRPHGGGDDALLDLGPHLVDLALLLGGRARLVAARCSRERAEIRLATARGPARLRCATDRPYLERVMVRSAGGRVLARAVRGGLLRATAARLVRRPHPLAESLDRQLAAFVTAARGGDPGPLATAADGERVMALIDEAAAAGAEAVPRAEVAR